MAEVYSVGSNVNIQAEVSGAVAELKALGLRVVMLTGDSRAVADAVAGELGIAEVRAEVLPADKAIDALVEIPDSDHKQALIALADFSVKRRS